jgi:TorA maturation chaperone TorD
MSETNIAAADLFLELANFWRPPDPIFWQEIANGVVDRTIAELAEKSGYHAHYPPLETFSACLPPLSTIQSFFLRYFIGVGPLSAMPVESLYKIWTEDATTRLPIAGSTGYLMGDSALHIQYLFNHYGLTTPPDYRMMPDHLSLLLELAALLLRNRTDMEVQIFLTQHFDWLEQFQQAMNQAAMTDDEGIQPALRFYRLALHTLNQTVKSQLQRYSQGQ